MITIGITGRSGCGKSTVTGIFKAHQVPFFDGDQASRELLLPGSPCLPLLAERFGADILDEQGALRRRLLADRAFKTPEGTAALNKITHPAILQLARQAQKAARESGAPLFLVDGAVLLDTPFEAICDRFLVITAPYEQSVARICARDGISPAMAMRRLDAQPTEEYLQSRANYLLCNDGTAAQLQEKAQALYAALLEEAHG